MTANRKVGMKACSIPAGLTISSAVSILVTFSLSLAIAILLNKENITWDQAGYCIMAMLFSASFLGSKSAIITIKHQRIPIAVMSGALYWGILLCTTALFFGGNFDCLWETAGIIIAGSISAALIRTPVIRKTAGKAKKVYC